MQPEREGYGARSEGVLAELLERSYPWAVGFFFRDTDWFCNNSYRDRKTV